MTVIHLVGFVVGWLVIWGFVWAWVSLQINGKFPWDSTIGGNEWVELAIMGGLIVFACLFSTFTSEPRAPSCHPMPIPGCEDPWF